MSAIIFSRASLRGLVSSLIQPSAKFSSCGQCGNVSGGVWRKPTLASPFNLRNNDPLFRKFSSNLKPDVIRSTSMAIDDIASEEKESKNRNGKGGITRIPGKLSKERNKLFKKKCKV